MIQRFLSYIDKENLITKGEKVLLAVSGGKDSMVLADLFLQCDLPFGLAHINHNTRGENSDGDEDFVKAFAEKNKVSFYSMKLDASISKASNFQARARELRYDWMIQLLEEHSYSNIATAHHQDDNIESFIMGLLRSSGTKGLSGIAPKKPNIIRPLLFANREDIDGYQQLHNISYREDESNASEKYLRNKIRHNVLKVLKQVDPQAVSKIDESIRIIAETNDLLEYFVNQECQIVKTTDDTIMVDLEALKKMPSQVAFLWFKLNYLGFTKSDIHDIIESSRSGAVFVTSSHQAVIDRDKIVIKPISLIQNNTDDDYQISIEGPGIYDLDNKHQLKISIADHLEFGKQANEEYLGFSDQPMPLLIRKRRHGDHFKPLGMNGRSQKLRDFIVNNKLSYEEKEHLWLLVDKNEDIVAIIPYRISDPYKVTVKSKHILKIEFIVR